MDFGGIDKKRLFVELQTAYYELTNRGLVRASCWIAEVLAGLNLPEPVADELVSQIDPPHLSVKSMQAKAYFDSHEFRRCWNSLESAKKRQDSAQLSNLDAFIHLFARYHDGEAQKEDAMGTEIFVDRTKENSPAMVVLNPYLEELHTSLLATTPDAHLHYLLGVVLRARRKIPEAKAQLIKSCVQFPYNWSAWLELRACFTRLVEIRATLDELQAQFASQPPEHRVMLAMFYCFVSEETDPNAAGTIITKRLLPLLPKFEGLHTQLARLYGAEGQYTEAVATFEKVLERDPFRIEDLDAYSNMLYVREQRTQLAHLAQHVAATDKYRTESSCIVANYYSLVGEHEKAVQSYQRAVLLDSNYVPAWTLMGHELIELCNPHAAIEAYRRAVEIAPFDYRPWFGLGQAYEILCMFSFALYYFQRSLALRPGDVRLWDSMGNCYEHLHRYEDAVNVFEQSYRISEGEAYYSYRLGMALHQLGKSEEALRYITECARTPDTAPGTVSGNTANAEPPFIRNASGLDTPDDIGMSDADSNSTMMATAANMTEDAVSEWPSRARLWLAKRALNLNRYSEAYDWVRRIQHGTREVLDEARSMERVARMNL